MALTKTLANKGYCLALISEMNDEELDATIKALEELIARRRNDKMRGFTPDDVAEVGSKNMELGE